MKYQRIREQLLSEIMTGAYTEDGAFPSENAVAERFGVSRMTARHALSELEREGYLTRIAGKGNLVKRRTFSQGFLTVKPFKIYAEEAGARPGTRLLKAEVAPLPAEGEQKLKAKSAVFVHRIRTLDGEAVIEEKRYLRHDLCASILKEDLENESIHDLLIQKLKLPLTKVWQRLNVVVLTPEQAQLFNCADGLPAFLLERVTYTLEQPVTWVTYLMRGDKYSFENEFYPQEIREPTRQ
jgi:GntR family transcriptional regulator